MDGDEEDDVHMCLVCNKTIQGLINYVNHKKNECSGKKVLKKPAFSPVTTSYTPAARSTDHTSVTASGQLPFNDQGFFVDPHYSNCHSGNYGSSSLLADQTSFLHTQASNYSTSTFHDADLQKILSPSPSGQVETELLSTQINSVFSNNPSTDSTQITCSLSPIFSTAENNTCTIVEACDDDSDDDDDDMNIDDQNSLHENHGIMNANIRLRGNPGSRRKVKSRQNINEEDLNSFSYTNQFNEDNKKDEKNGKEEVLDDFFQSLELMSKTDRRTEKGSSFNQLPIATILNSLTFESDEEDLGFSFGEDVSFDSLDDSNDGMAPPRHHTGGKWKPGEKPTAYKKNRQQYRGKWPPGEGPYQSEVARKKGPSHRGKNISLIKGMETKSRPKGRGKGRPAKKRSTTKRELHCTFCNLTFDNRFKYSNHCRSLTHKANVFGAPRVDSESSSSVQLEANTTNELLGSSNKDDNEGGIPSIENETESGANVEVGGSDSLSTTDIPIVKTEVTVLQCDNDSDNEMDRNDDNVNDDNDKSDENKDDDNNDNAEEERLDGEDQETVALMKIHICTVCDKKYPNKFLIAKHLLSKYHKNRAAAHQKEQFEMLQKYHNCIVRLSPYQCAVCKFYYVNYEEFKAHVHSDSHASKCASLIGEMQCSLCKFQSHEMSDIFTHFDSSDHVTAIMKYNKVCILKEVHVKSECKYCGLEMRSYTRLLRHVQLKHADGIKVEGVKKVVKGVRNHPICSYCSKQVRSESALELHVQRRHTFIKKCKCELCDKSFADKYTLKLHCKSLAHNQNVVLSNRESQLHMVPENKVALQHDTETTEESNNSTNTKDNGSESTVIQANNSMASLNNDTVEGRDQHESPIVQQYENVKYGGLEGTLEVKYGGLEVTSEVNSATVGTQAAEDSDTDCGYLDKNDDEYMPATTGRTKLPVTKYEKRTNKNKNPKRSPKKKDFKCDYCDFMATQYDDLRPHYMEKHSTVIQTCEPCDQIFLSRKALKIHCNSISHQKNLGTSATVDQKLFECHICKKKYEDENYKNFHTAYQHLHANTEASALAENGGKSITQEKYKDFLKECESYRFDDRIKCIDCPAMIKKSNIHVHLRLHTDERLFKCRMCDKSFIASFTLRKHLLQHFGCTDRMCEVCGKSFKKRCAFQKHMKVHQAESQFGVKMFKCNICEMSFYLESQLKRHATRHKEKKYKCDYPGCLWKFVMRGELNAHVRTHTDNKKFLCDLCGFASHTPYHLKRHKKVHSCERKLRCEYCTYKTGNTTHLQRHMRIHIGSKPFKCPYCSYACNTHENIRKHITETKKHEGKKMYPCKFCEYATNSCKEFRKHLLTEHEQQSGLGESFRDPALTTFTGVYDRKQDPKQPLEGMKIIPLKERKKSRRKVADSDEEDARLGGGEGEVTPAKHVKYESNSDQYVLVKTELPNSNETPQNTKKKRSRKQQGTYKTEKFNQLSEHSDESYRHHNEYSQTANRIATHDNTRSAGHDSTLHIPATESDGKQVKNQGYIRHRIIRQSEPPIQLHTNQPAASSQSAFHAHSRTSSGYPGYQNTVVNTLPEMTGPFIMPISGNNYSKQTSEAAQSYHDYSMRFAGSREHRMDNNLVIDMNSNM